MKKRVFTLLLALGLALTLGGCGDKARPASDAPSEPSSIEVRPESSKPEGSGTEENGVAEPPVVDDALVKEIVLAYGAIEDTLNEPVQLRPRSGSLYLIDWSWEYSIDLQCNHYLRWFESTLTGEEFDALASVRDTTVPGCFFYPQEAVEEKVQRYFDYDVGYLRNNSTYYREDLQGYVIRMGGGKGETPTLTYEYEAWDRYITITATVEYQDSPEDNLRHTLHVSLDEDGGWKYMGDKVEHLS